MTRYRQSEKPVAFEGICCDVETEKAIMVVIEDEEVWIPKS